MAIVRVEPIGIDLRLRDGESIMAAAERSGYRWPTVCEGQGSCRTCYLTVLEGAENLSSVEPYERAGLETMVSGGRKIDQIRLACQAKAVGNAVVRKLGVRRTGA